MHTCSVPFVCLPPTYAQHEHESFPCLQLLTMLHLCAPAHTPECHNGAPWTSPSMWHPVASVSFLFSLSVASSSAQSSPSISLELVTSPNTHVTVTSPGSCCSQGRRALCQWRGRLTPPPCLGLQGETAQGKVLEDVKHLSVSSRALNVQNMSVNFICCQYQLKEMPTCVVWEVKVTVQGHYHVSEVVFSSAAGPCLLVPCLRCLCSLPFIFYQVGQGPFVRTKLWDTSWSLHEG